MILGRRFADVGSPLGGEFQMVGLLGMSKDDAIKAVMVFKLGEYHALQPCGIHLGNGCSIVGRSGDTYESTSVHSSASSAYGRTPGLHCMLQRVSSLRLVDGICPSSLVRV